MSRAPWIVAAAAAAIACSGSPTPAKPGDSAPVAVVRDAGPAIDAAPLDQDLARLADRSLALYHDIAKAFAESGEDCKTASARLGRLASEYREVTTANTKVLQDGRAKQLQAALDQHGDDFDRAAKTVMQSPTMSKCAKDRAFAKAFDDLLEPPP
jgi:hypothetical protein